MGSVVLHGGVGHRGHSALPTAASTHSHVVLCGVTQNEKEMFRHVRSLPCNMARDDEHLILLQLSELFLKGNPVAQKEASCRWVAQTEEEEEIVLHSKEKF